jgi:hypothetical protein
MPFAGALAPLALVAGLAASANDPPDAPSSPTTPAPASATTEAGAPAAAGGAAAPAAAAQPAASAPPAAAGDASAAATSAAARDVVAEAEAALRAGLHKKCVDLALRALSTGRLDAAAVARAWLVRGRCHAAAGDPDRAERCYAAAVRVQPDLVAPTDDAVFARVRPEGTAPASALSLQAAAVVLAPPAAGGAATVGVVTTINDDLALGRVFVVLDAEAREVARAPIERAPDATGDAFVRPGHRFSGFAVVDLRVRLLDRYGNVLREAPVVIDATARAALATATASSPTAAPTSTTTWVSLAGAGVATAGLALAATGGIAFSVAAQADPDRVIDDEGPAFAAFAGGVVLFVVGGAVVVVDQLPR